VLGTLEEAHVRLLDLWRWNGRVDRKTYAVVGVLAFFVKRLLDELVVQYFFHGHIATMTFNYWVPLGSPVRFSNLSGHQTNFLATILLVATPFIWLGLAMTAKRLRDVGWPVWLAVLFFVPVVNVVFLAALCFAPSAQKVRQSEAAPWPGPRALDRIIPHNRVASALLAILLTTILGLVAALVETAALQTYGWGLFVALPFCLGLSSVLLHSYHQPRKFGESIAVAVLPVAILGIALLLVAVEGIVCLLMAAPLAAALAALGGMLGYTIQASHWGSRHSPSMLCVALLAVPAVFAGEHAAKLETPRYVVRTAIEINAPPEQVWRQVVAFTEIPPPQEILFRAGIAYPIRAEIAGHGPGAVRRCVFSTGAFVEPIEVWDAPRLLKFGVTESPSPLNELTPYGHIEPRHLHGYFVSEQGQFALTALPDGRTRLEGTTSYRDAIWPGEYWRFWSDYIIHRIHLRVLEHIKNEAESNTPS